MPAGRPREFDEESVLDTAMRHFWREGYANARLDDIARLAGVTKPSLYLAFGDKEGLYRRALDRYSFLFADRVMNAFEREPDIVLALTAYFDEVVAILTEKGLPPGCLRVNTSSELAKANPGLAEMAAQMRGETRDVIAARLRDLGLHAAQALDVAEMTVTLSDGLAMAARVGTPPEQLRRTARKASRAVAALTV